VLIAVKRADIGPDDVAVEDDDDILQILLKI